MPVSRPFADSVDQKDSSQRSEMCAESSSTRYLLPTLLYFQYGTSEAGDYVVLDGYISTYTV